MYTFISWRVYQQRQALVDKAAVAARDTAAAKIQALVRGKKARLHVADLRVARRVAAATRIQSVWRMHTCIVALRTARHAATTIQAAWRGVVARRTVAEMRRVRTVQTRAVIVLQKCVRKKRAVRVVAKLRHDKRTRAAICIQVSALSLCLSLSLSLSLCVCVCVRWSHKGNHSNPKEGCVRCRFDH